MYDAMGLMTPPPTRPTPLVEVRPLGRVQRHAVEHLADLAPLVQILDGPRAAGGGLCDGFLPSLGPAGCRVGYRSAQDFLLSVSIAFFCS